jgi:hypothetical protein
VAPPSPKTEPPPPAAQPPILKPQPDRIVLLAAAVCLAAFIAGLVFRRR